jgi:pSer/pThr/pTyr-binding forkhead associated (FHA) protein
MIPAMAKPVRCQRCGRENDPSFAFCLDCGQSLRPPPLPTAEPTCASCGAALQPGFRFCGICGKPIGAPPPTPAVPSGPPSSGPHRAQPAAHTALHVAQPRPAPPRFRVTTVRSDGMAGVSFSLDRDEVVCGRTEGEVRLADDPTVSPRHARFLQSSGVLRVEDLGSVNGTFLRLKEPRRISVGEELRLGRQLLRLEPLPRPAHAEERGVRPWGTPDAGCRLRLSQLLEGGGLGEIFPLKEGENLVGRDAGEVTFPSDRYVSARHARIDVAGAEVTLTDVGSSNGTFAKILGQVELAPGDQLLVGGQLLRVDA